MKVQWTNGSETREGTVIARTQTAPGVILTVETPDGETEVPASLVTILEGDAPTPQRGSRNRKA